MFLLVATNHELKDGFDVMSLVISVGDSKQLAFKSNKDGAEPTSSLIPKVERWTELQQNLLEGS